MKLEYCSFYRTDLAGMQFHLHDHYQLHYIMGGKGCYEIEKGEKIDAAEGNFFVIFPEEPHRVVLESTRKPLVEYLIGCHFDGDCSFMEEFFNKELRRVRVLKEMKISRQFFEGIRHRILSQDKLVCQSAFLNLFSRICGIHSSFGQMTYSTLIEDALVILQERVEDALDLDELCRELSVSKCHFIRNFKKYTGLPPMRYFMGLKIETAKVMLAQSDIPLKQIADRLAFADEFHFSKRFKKVAGRSPSEFRLSTRSSG